VRLESDLAAGPIAALSLYTLLWSEWRSGHTKREARSDPPTEPVNGGLPLVVLNGAEESCSRTRNGRSSNRQFGEMERPFAHRTQEDDRVAVAPPSRRDDAIDIEKREYP
jgi:hypothetical protein